MPIKQSAKKALRQSKKRRERNKTRKQVYKKLRKQILDFLSQGEKDKARQLLPQFQKAVDKAAKTGAIHINKASRLKSRLAQKIGQ